jgi:uncharacterized protein (DUF736 family)
MNLQRMRHHLILAWERSIARTLTAIATVHRAPKDGLLSRVRTIVVSVEIVPAAKTPSAASQVGALEVERAWTGRSVDGADVGSGILLRSTW